MSTHTTQLNSPYLTWSQPNSTNSTQLTHLVPSSDQLKSADLNSLISTQLTLLTKHNSLNTTHSSQLNYIQLKSANLNSHNSTQLNSPYFTWSKLNFSVHLSPGSSSFLPKYDINNNYSKLVWAIFTKLRTMIELRSVNIF